MKLPALVLATTTLALAACGDSGQDPEGPVDTSYEQGLPAPMERTPGDDAPAQANDTVTGGPDEQVDAMVAGEAPPVKADAKSAAPAGNGATPAATAATNREE